MCIYICKLTYHSLSYSTTRNANARLFLVKGPPIGARYGISNEPFIRSRCLTPPKPRCFFGEPFDTILFCIRGLAPPKPTSLLPWGRRPPDHPLSISPNMGHVGYDTCAMIIIHAYAMIIIQACTMITCMHEHSTCMYYDHNTCMCYDHSACM